MVGVHAGRRSDGGGGVNCIFLQKNVIIVKHYISLGEDIDKCRANIIHILNMGDVDCRIPDSSATETTYWQLIMDYGVRGVAIMSSSHQLLEYALSNKLSYTFRRKQSIAHKTTGRRSNLFVCVRGKDHDVVCLNRSITFNLPAKVSRYRLLHEHTSVVLIRIHVDFHSQTWLIFDIVG